MPIQNLSIPSMLFTPLRSYASCNRFQVSYNIAPTQEVAGLWEAWQNGEEIRSCSIITTDANDLMV